MFESAERLTVASMGSFPPSRVAGRLWTWLAPPDPPSSPRRRTARVTRPWGAAPTPPRTSPLSWSDMQGVRSPGWADIVASALLVLAVAVPTMIIEEDWHGRPMIDQSTHLWIIAASLVATAFFIGGAVVAFRRPSAPTRYAAATAIVAVGVLLMGALYRRIWMAHEHISHPVQHLWILGVMAALVMSLAGSVFGRQLTR
jgi:hypothetical protein